MVKDVWNLAVYEQHDMDSSFDAAVQLLKTYTTDIPVKNDKYVSLLITALSVTAKEWKSPK